MITTVGTESDFTTLLKNLLELEYDALEAYKAAIDRLDNNEFKKQFQSFKSDHELHIKDLTKVLENANQNPPKGGSIKQILTKGKVFLATVMGDKAILQAMKTNEDDTNTAYEKAVGHKNKTQEAAPILDKALEDERRHRAWIEETIRRL